MPEVSSGSDWLVENGNRRYWSIGLNDNDGRDILGDKYDEKSWDEKRNWLAKRADLEVIAYMYKEGAISKEYAQKRAQEIKAR